MPCSHRLRSLIVLAALAVSLVACGGKAVIDGDSGEGGEAELCGCEQFCAFVEGSPTGCGFFSNGESCREAWCDDGEDTPFGPEFLRCWCSAGRDCAAAAECLM